MRLTLLVSSFALVFAAAAHAQTELLTARPAPGTGNTVDRAGYPRDVERGDAILELSYQGPARRILGDAAANESALELMQIDGGAEVFCGTAAATADLAATAATPKPVMSCFEDADNDGAADRIYAVVRNTGTLTLGQPTMLPAPRAWTAADGERRRLSVRYGGPSSGYVLDGGRLGEAAVEINMVVIGEAGAQPAREPMVLPCLDDGRCMPLPLERDAIILVSNPTVEGEAHVDLVSADTAVAVINQMSAALTARNARRTAPAATEPPEALAADEEETGQPAPTP